MKKFKFENEVDKFSLIVHNTINLKIKVVVVIENIINIFSCVLRFICLRNK